MPKLGIFGNSEEVNTFTMPLFGVSSYFSEPLDCLPRRDTVCVFGGGGGTFHDVISFE
jgi:hypothetical protein